MSGANPATVVYWALAAASGVIVGLDLMPYPLEYIVLIGLGLAATVIRRRTQGSDSIVASVLWLLLFAAVVLPTAFIFHKFPFGTG